MVKGLIMFHGFEIAYLQFAFISKRWKLTHTSDNSFRSWSTIGYPGISLNRKCSNSSFEIPEYTGEFPANMYDNAMAEGPFPDHIKHIACFNI